MKLRHADLIVVLCCLVLAAVILQFASSWLVPRVAITILLVFYLPGYTLLCAASPLGEWGFAEMLPLCIGLSMAVGVLGTLALHLFRFGLYQNTWFGMYLTVCIVCVLIALWQRQALDAPPPLTIRMPKPRLLPLIPVGMAAILLVGAWVIGTNAQTQQQRDTFTQLWAVPCKDTSCDIQVGIYNYEWHPEEYRVVLMANAQVIEEWDDIALNHDKTWTTSVTLPASYPTGTRLLVRLFRTEAPEETYRFVSLRYQS